MAYYGILEGIRGALSADPLVTTITEGTIDEVNINRADLFPLCHIMCNSVTVDNNTMTFNFSIIAVDNVDESNVPESSKFIGADNTQDVHNQMLLILNRLFKLANSGSLFDQHYQIEESATLEPFTDRFENKLAGWTMTFDIVVPNEMSIC